MLSQDLSQELRTLEIETFEVVDMIDLGLDAADTVGGVEGIGREDELALAACSSSCSCSSCCSCSTSSCCSTSTSTSSCG